MQNLSLGNKHFSNNNSVFAVIASYNIMVLGTEEAKK